MLAVQVIVLGIGYHWLDEYYFFIHSATVVLSLAISVHEVNKTSEPAFKIAWIMLIAFIPVFGALLYLYLHMSPVTGELQKSYVLQQRITSSLMEQDERVFKELTERHVQAPGLAKYLRLNSGSPVYKNTRVTYYEMGEEAIEAIKEDLRKAEKFIFLEFFIINSSGTVWNEILEILKHKAKSGVEVRLSYDGMGCMGILPRRYPEILGEYGIKCKVFAPIMPLLSTYQNNRDHRKICVVDGKVAYTGGINLADEYANRIVRFGRWKDNAVRLEGSAAAGFTSLFLEVWNCAERPGSDDYAKYINMSKNAGIHGAEGFVIPFGDCPLDNIAVGKRVYLDNLNNAKHYVHIMTPYLVLDSEMYETMRYAAQRGVEVALILPHIPDKPYAFWLARTYYRELLQAGIKIYEYTPGFVHAKMSVTDGERAVVGTINHDYRSLYLHYECAVYMLDVPEITKMEIDFQDTLKKCEEITPEKCAHFPVYQKLFGKVERIIAPLI